MPSIDTIVLFDKAGFRLQSHMCEIFLRHLQPNEFVIMNFRLLELGKTEIPEHRRM